MIAQELNARIVAARGFLGARGWAQGVEENSVGQVRLNGAIRYCAPQTGDENIIRAVLRHQGRDDDWNDDPRRTEDEVRDFVANFEITDTDLGATFGHHWMEVVQLVRQAATLTIDQAHQIHTAQTAGLYAARDAAVYAARDDGRDAAMGAAMDAARDAAPVSALYAAGYAALAIVTQDLISPEHHRALMGKWRSAFPDA